MKGYQFTMKVAGVPVGMPRLKARALPPKPGQRFGQAQIYTPTTVKNPRTNKYEPHPIVEFKKAIRAAACKHWKRLPLKETAVRVDLVFVFPRQANRVWKTKPMPRYLHTTKPDRDNLDKAVLDALTEIVWVDDSVVCAGSIEKWHARGGEEAHTEITITVLEGEEILLPSPPRNLAGANYVV